MRTSPLIATAVALICGLVLFASSGTAQAGMAAANASSDADCSWIIMTPPGFGGPGGIGKTCIVPVLNPVLRLLPGTCNWLAPLMPPGWGPDSELTPLGCEIDDHNP